LRSQNVKRFNRECAEKGGAKSEKSKCVYRRGGEKDKGESATQMT